MSRKVNSEIAVIGIDLGKNSFRLVGPHDAAPTRNVMNSRRLMTFASAHLSSLVDRLSRKRIGILNWDFREKQPTERRNRGVGHEHVVAIDVFPRHSLRWGRNPDAARRLHLGEARKIALE